MKMLKYPFKNLLKNKAVSISLFFLLFFILVPMSSFGMEKFDVKVASIDVVVDENQDYHITERLALSFHTPSHGIYRFIPLKSGNHSAKVSNVKVSILEEALSISYPVPYNCSIQSQNYVIKIGDPSRYVNGNITYLIQYTLTPYGDTSKDFDDVYLNLIGTDWNCSFEKVLFSLSFPKDFEANQVYFTSGSYGSFEASEIVACQKEGLILKGETTSVLSPHEGLTIRILLPKGYFNKTSSFAVIFPWLIILLMVIVLIVAAILVIRCRKTIKDLPSPITFFPPANLNPAELGYLIDKHCSAKDITSLIFYWASKGYLRIKDTNGSILLIKLKDLDTGSHYEQVLFEALFTSSLVEGFADTSMLKGNLYSHIEHARKQVKTYVNRQLNPFNPRAKNLFWIMKGISIFLLCLLVIAINCIYVSFSDLVIVLPNLVITCILFAAILFVSDVIMHKVRGTFSPSTKAIFYSLLSNIPVVAVVLAFLISMSHSFFVTLHLVMAIPIMIGIFMLSHFDLMIYDHAKKLYGEVLGFKEFLKTAEKPRLEALLESNPSYFFDILPYAIVLNVTDVWASKFESLSSFKSPTWYSSNSLSYFGYSLFAQSIYSSFNSMSVNLCTPGPRKFAKGSDSGKGFFGGGGSGGFSGGGFGGGGGGSW